MWITVGDKQHGIEADDAQCYERQWGAWCNKTEYACHQNAVDMHCSDGCLASGQTVHIHEVTQMFRLVKPQSLGTTLEL